VDVYKVIQLTRCLVKYPGAQETVLKLSSLECKQTKIMAEIAPYVASFLLRLKYAVLNVLTKIAFSQGKSITPPMLF
jgi:hypothetical protein